MAENEIMDAVTNIKNILFSKPMPNIVIPISTVGHKIYPCIDCGDSFVLESNYEYHVNRKSLKIIFKCRQCNEIKIFNNRCRLLSHIRQHGPKSIKIHVNDLTSEPLPLCEYLKLTNIRKETVTEKLFQIATVAQANNRVSVHCFECKILLTDKGPPNKVRAKHFSQITGRIYSCPVCTFKSLTICGFKTHLRLHLRKPPHFCPECGCLLDLTSVVYPFDHDCSGFKIMNVTSRCICPIAECTKTLLDLSTLIEHFNNKHVKKILDVSKHNHDITIFYKCQMCPGRLILQNRIDSHVNSHCKNFVYLCQQCQQIFIDVKKLFNHYVSLHHTSDDIINILNAINFNNRSLLRQDVTDTLESTNVTSIMNIGSEGAITVHPESFEPCRQSEVMILDQHTIVSDSINTTALEKNVTSHEALTVDLEPSMSYCENDIITLSRDGIASKSINMTGFENVLSNEAIAAGAETPISNCNNDVFILNEETFSSHLTVEANLQSPSVSCEGDVIIINEGTTTSSKSINITTLEKNVSKNVAIAAHPVFLNATDIEKNMSQLPNLDVSQQSNTNCGFEGNFLKIQYPITNITSGQKTSNSKESVIACHICNKKLKQKWEVVKTHYSKYHREIHCVEPQINICKVDIGKNTRIQVKRKNRNVKNKSVNRKNVQKKVMTTDNMLKDNLSPPPEINTFICKKCGMQFEDKQSLETHMISHRDPYLAYQCVECGECFAVKYSFNIHLLIEHDISDVESYIKKKECFYESAFEHQDFSIPEEPLSDNQCSVCRQKFDNEYDFQRHFRSHGLAFLKKNMEIRQNIH